MIQRFSEDLDLMVQHGTVTGLPKVTNWTSTNKGPVMQRRAPVALAQDMLGQKDIAALPRPDEPALVLASPEKRAAIEKAYARIAPMYWEPRIPIEEACETIRAWLGKRPLSG